MNGRVRWSVLARTAGLETERDFLYFDTEESDWLDFSVDVEQESVKQTEAMSLQSGPEAQRPKFRPVSDFSEPASSE